MPTARASTTIDVPVRAAFTYVDDWTNASVFTQDLIRWEPAGDQTAGLGASFHAALKLGPTTQESTLEITSYEQDAVIGWEPRDGFPQRGTYTFAPSGDGTQVSLEISFDLPGGIAGRILGKTIEPAAKQNVTKTLANLKRELEQAA